MSWFRRKRGATPSAASVAILPPPAAPLHPAPARPQPGRHVPPRTGATFLVSGVSFRQDALARMGRCGQVFHLVREPSNAHDPNAVAVYCQGSHIGYLSAKVSARWAKAVARIEATGSELWINGSIRQGEMGLCAVIDGPYPEDI